MEKPKTIQDIIDESLALWEDEEDAELEEIKEEENK